MSKLGEMGLFLVLIIAMTPLGFVLMPLMVVVTVIISLYTEALGFLHMGEKS